MPACAGTRIDRFAYNAGRRPAAPLTARSAGDRGPCRRSRKHGQSGMSSDPLKLIALDAEDLAVISAHIQDARVQAADIVWRQDEKRLVVGMNRLDWDQTLSGGTEPRRLVAA